jgi:S1-C subfamily serine protease
MANLLMSVLSMAMSVFSEAIFGNPHPRASRRSGTEAGGAMKRLLAVLCLSGCLQAAEEKTNALAGFSGALERLAATVAPAVVQVQVSSWCASGSGAGEDAATLAPCRVVGSGVIVDSSGYIVTNEHVVRNATSVRVMLTPKADAATDTPPVPGKQQVLDSVLMGANREPPGKRQVLDAAVLGANRETDIALLKIEAAGLPSIPLKAAGRGPRQGQVVLTVGSPEGLDNTMTIGIVSAVGRQPHPDFRCCISRPTPRLTPETAAVPCWELRAN